MLKKFYFLFIVTITTGFGLLLCSNAYAAAVLSEFTITINKIEASTDGGTTYSTLFDGEAGMNIASASAGAQVDYTFPISTEIPLGSTINKVRVTIDDQLSFTGYYDSGSYYYYHGSEIAAEYSNLLYPDGDVKGARAETEPTPGKVTVTDMPEGVYMATLDTSISVSESQNTTLKLNFDLSNSIAGTYSVPDTWVYPKALNLYCSIGE